MIPQHGMPSNEAMSMVMSLQSKSIWSTNRLCIGKKTYSCYQVDQPGRVILTKNISITWRMGRWSTNQTHRHEGPYIMPHLCYKNRQKLQDHHEILERRIVMWASGDLDLCESSQIQDYLGKAIYREDNDNKRMTIAFRNKMQKGDENNALNRVPT